MAEADREGGQQKDAEWGQRLGAAEQETERLRGDIQTLNEPIEGLDLQNQVPACMWVSVLVSVRCPCRWGGLGLLEPPFRGFRPHTDIPQIYMALD